jgi:hydrogenase nickel incorporation protein HypA/HybF
MHELSIALSMIEGVLEEVKRQGDVHVEAVHIKLGVFSGVDKNALEFSYGVACEGTLLQGSHLIIEEVPILMHCPTCGDERTVPSLRQLCCPDCQTPADEILRGQELEITALEVSV